MWDEYTIKARGVSWEQLHDDLLRFERGEEDWWNRVDPDQLTEDIIVEALRSPDNPDSSARKRAFLREHSMRWPSPGMTTTKHPLRSDVARALLAERKVTPNWNHGLNMFREELAQWDGDRGRLTKDCSDYHCRCIFKEAGIPIPRKEVLTDLRCMVERYHSKIGPYLETRLSDSDIISCASRYFGSDCSDLT